MAITQSSYNTSLQLSACRVAATSNVAGIYFNGPVQNGVKATLTSLSASGPISIDSTNLVVGDRVLLSAQTNGNECGIYYVKVVGDAIEIPWVLERTNDFQCLEQLKIGQYIPIGDGSTNIGKIFIVEAPLPATFGVDDLEISFPNSSGGGEASNKDVTDNALPLVASVDGSFTVGHALVAADTSGTIEDSSFPLGDACTRQATDVAQSHVASVDPNTIIASGDGIYFSDTVGTIQSTGAAAAIPSNSANGSVASVENAPVTVGHLAVFADTNGSIEDGGTVPVMPSLPLSVSDGGTGVDNSLLLFNGGVAYTDGAGITLTSPTSVAQQVLLSGSNAAPFWSTCTLPGTTTANQLLYSVANDQIAGLSTANNGVLVTNGSGVPSFVNSYSSFSPSFSGSTAPPAALNYTRQVGRYTIIGNMVQLYIRLAIDSLTLGGAAGDLWITGLPVASVNDIVSIQLFSIQADSLTYTGSQLVATLEPNSQNLTITQFTSAMAASNVAVTSLTASTQIIIQGYYFTS